MKTNNSFFLYEGDILRAAQWHLRNILGYYKPGRTVFFGTPENHTTDITKVVKKLIIKDTL